MDKSMQTEIHFAAFVAVDWADQEHHFAYRGSDCKRIVSGKVQHKKEALEGWVLQLRSEFPEGKIALIVEQSRGGLLYALMKYDFFVFYLPNPRSVARYREVFHCSGSKSDPSDTLLLLDLLEKHRDKLRVWNPEDSQTRRLRMLTEYRRRLVNDRSKLVNRLTSILKCYFPEALGLTGDLTKQLAAEFLLKWNTLAAVKKAKPVTLRRFYRKHHCRNTKLIEQRIQEITNATALITDEAIISASAQMVRVIVLQLSKLLEGIKQFDQQIASLFEQHPDRAFYESLPGAGPALEPRIAVAFGSDRSRFDSAQEIQQFSGTAPVTRSSGNSKIVYRRWACSKFILQTFHEFAAHSIPQSRWANAYYHLQLQRGKSHHAAVRSLAYKWIRILFRCWKENMPYNESFYLNSLTKTGSHLALLIAQ
jgi:transposase